MLQIGRSLFRSQLVSVDFSLTFRSHCGPGVDSAPNRNEYQEYFLGVKSGRCVRLTTYYHPVPLSRNLRTVTSWNPLGLSRPVMGLLCFIWKRQDCTNIIVAIKHCYFYYVFTTLITFSTPPECPFRQWGPPSLLSKGWGFFSGRDLKLTTYLHLVLRLRMNEALVLLPFHTFIAEQGTTLPLRRS